MLTTSLFSKFQQSALHKSKFFNMLTQLGYVGTFSSIWRRFPDLIEILQNIKKLYQRSEIFVGET